LKACIGKNNNQDASVYLSPYSFSRLKTSDSVIPPEYSSDLSNFYVISPNTTGITGPAIFNVTPSSDGKYTLIFQKESNINEVDLPMQLS
jgi:cytochrome c oxidase assembly protein Cox11